MTGILFRECIYDLRVLEKGSISVTKIMNEINEVCDEREKQGVVIKRLSRKRTTGETKYSR
jgi:hypothetical protein